MKTLLRFLIAVGVVIALEITIHYVYGQKQMQAMAGPQQPHADQGVHHPDLDNRADLLGVEMGFMRGATVFIDPGYRDFPNAAQMQISPLP